MKIKNVPYFKTSLKIDNNIKKSAETGWLTTGPMVKQFESEISDYTGAKYGCTTLYSRITFSISCTGY